MPLELIADRPSHAVLRDYEDGPFQVRPAEVGIAKIGPAGDFWIIQPAFLKPFFVGLDRARQVLDFSPLRIGARLALLGVACCGHQEAEENKPEDGFERGHGRGASLRAGVDHCSAR